MLLFLFMAAVIALGLAAWNFNSVQDELRRTLPSHLSELDLRWAVGTHVWSPLASDAVRRRFVWSNLWASVSFSLWAIILWVFGELIGAALFAGLAVLAVIYRVAVLPLSNARGRISGDAHKAVGFCGVHSQGEAPYLLPGIDGYCS